MGEPLLPLRGIEEFMSNELDWRCLEEPLDGFLRLLDSLLGGGKLNWLGGGIAG